MTKRQLKFRFMTPLSAALVVLGASSLAACSGDANPPDMAGSQAGSAGSATAGGGGDMAGAGGAAGNSAGTSNGGGMVLPPPPEGECVGNQVTTQKRVVKLTDNQLVNTYMALFGEAAAELFAGEDVVDATLRAFPPLATLGTTLGQSEFDLRDRAARGAMTLVASEFEGEAACDAGCGLEKVLSFATEAYRRPLSEEEKTSYQTLWTELTETNGGSVAEAVQFGYDAVLLSPGFLYRTEIGDGFEIQGSLSQHEIASEVSYFLTDGPPDAELRAAADAGQLSDKNTLRAHAMRLLATPEAKANLEAAMTGYFQLTTVPGIVLDEDATPGFEVTSGLKNSMYREAQEFLSHVLWEGSLGDLITTRRGWVNNMLANDVYGIDAPTDDQNTFTEVELPEGRSGLLTLAAFLTSKSRPNGTSVVGRGLALNAALVCSQNPPPPTDPAILGVIADQEGWTEKEKADFRADPMRGTVCAGCHGQFDAMGMVLENYDAVGRYRTADKDGNPIDANWTVAKLPTAFSYDQDGDQVPDRATVSTPEQFAEALLRMEPTWGTNALTRCMTMNFINYALADEGQGSARAEQPDHPTNSCAVRAVTNAFEALPEKSFSALVAEIVASDTLSIRTPGN